MCDGCGMDLFRKIVEISGNYKPEGLRTTYFTKWCAKNNYVELIQEGCAAIYFKARKVGDFVEILRRLAVHGYYLHSMFYRHDPTSESGLSFAGECDYTVEALETNLNDIQTKLKNLLEIDVLNILGASQLAVEGGEEILMFKKLRDRYALNDCDLIKSTKISPFPLGIFIDPFFMNEITDLARNNKTPYERMNDIILFLKAISTNGQAIFFGNVPEEGKQYLTQILERGLLQSNKQ